MANYLLLMAWAVKYNDQLGYMLGAGVAHVCQNGRGPQVCLVVVKLIGQKGSVQLSLDVGLSSLGG